MSEEKPAEEKPEEKPAAVFKSDKQDAEVLGDEYEHYNYDHDKHMFSGHSGKGRSKKEASQHTNHPDPCGHTRKTTQKLLNNHEKEKQHNKAKGD